MSDLDSEVDSSGTAQIESVRDANGGQESGDASSEGITKNESGTLDQKEGGSKKPSTTGYGKESQGGKAVAGLPLGVGQKGPGAPRNIQQVRGGVVGKVVGSGKPVAINGIQPISTQSEPGSTNQSTGGGDPIMSSSENTGGADDVNEDLALQGEVNSDAENADTGEEDDVLSEDEKEEDLSTQIFPFNATLYSTSSRTIPFANIYKTEKGSNEFYDALNSGQVDRVLENAVYVATSDVEGKLSFEVSGSANAIILFGEYAGVIRIVFENMVDASTAWDNSYVTLEDVEDIYTFRGKVVDEEDKPLRYAEILMDESLLDADFEQKGAGTHAKTDKYGKYVFNVRVEAFPIDVICKVKDRLPEKETIQYDNGRSLFIDNIDFVVPKDKFHAVIKNGLEWLVQQQNGSSGAFGRNHPQISTSLACLSLIAQGHISKSSVYSENLRKGLTYLCAEAKKKNNYYFGEGRMYSHALVSLALSESLGVLQEKKDNDMVRGALEKTVEHIVESQNQKEGTDHFGGWRYTPRSKDSDLSVSALQILALHSAMKNGMSVPSQTLEKASGFVRNMYSDSMKCFLYAKPNKTTTAMRSAGVVAMNVLKLNLSKEDVTKITQSAKALLNYRPQKKTRYFWYTNYYAFTAASIMGGRHDDFIPALKETIIEKQNESGSFEGEKKYGEVYSTAFALIILGSPIVY